MYSSLHVAILTVKQENMANESSSKAEETSRLPSTASQRLEAIKQEEIELLAKLNSKKQHLQDELRNEFETAIKNVAKVHKNYIECGATNVWANETIKPLLLELGLSDGTGLIKESDIGTEAFLTKYNLRLKKAAGSKRGPRKTDGAIKEAEANNEEGLAADQVAGHQDIGPGQ